MLLQVEIGLAFSAAHFADVRIGRRDQALALEQIDFLAVSALLYYPLGQVDEGVAVSVG